jgi:outer membrane protein assembly factor BamB
MKSLGLVMRVLLGLLVFIVLALASRVMATQEREPQARTKLKLSTKNGSVHVWQALSDGNLVVRGDSYSLFKVTAEGKVVASLGQANLICFIHEFADGSLLIRHNTEAQLKPPCKCLLDCYSPAGELRWSMALDPLAISWGNIEAGDNCIFCQKNELLCVDSDGTTLWTKREAGAVYLERQGTVGEQETFFYQTSPDPRTAAELVCMNSAGDEVWRVQMEEPGGIFQRLDSYLTIARNQSLSAYDFSGQHLWQQPVDWNVLGGHSFAHFGDKLLAQGRWGAWEFNKGGRRSSRPDQALNVCLGHTPTADGGLATLSADTGGWFKDATNWARGLLGHEVETELTLRRFDSHGRKLWRASLPASASGLVELSDGRLVISDNDALVVFAP